MLEIALGIVETAFVGKKDKAGNPYIEHLIRVSKHAGKYYTGDTKYKADVEVIGLLHDLLEDCPEWTIKHLAAIFKDASILTAIEKLTHKEEDSYDTYIEGLRSNPYARAVKLADLEDNMNLTRLTVITEKEIERMRKYHKAFIYLKAIREDMNNGSNLR